MNVDAFSYLFAKSAGATADELESLARIAAKRRVDEGIPLSDSVEKLARDYELNGNQIERVCEMANLATHQALWSRTMDKAKVAFDLADAQKVKSKAGPAEARRRLPQLDADYARPPQEIPGTSASLAELMGVGEGGGHQGLAGPSERQRLIIVLQKKAAERQRARDRLLTAGMKAETSVKLAYRAVKQELLGGASTYDLLRAAKAAGFEKVARALLPAFETRLISEVAGRRRAELEKQAISRAPEELISDALGATTIVNGAHPLLVSLDIVHRSNEAVRELCQHLLRVDDELQVLRQRLRALG